MERSRRAIAAGVLLLAPAGTGRVETDGRRLGVVLLPTVLAIVLLDAVASVTGSGGADSGAGLVRLVLLAGIGMLTARLAVGVAAQRRTR